MKDPNKQIFLFLFIAALLATLTGINDNFFTDDPALYGSIARQIMYHHQPWFLYSYGKDWLDKPHFPFWATWVSFNLFGVHTWSYRLPALLFFLLGAVYTYLFARKYYGFEIAAGAVLILMVSLHIMMSNTDVRAEPYLTGMLIGAIYHISNLQKRFTFADLIAAALLTALAIMTKGIFVLVAIAGALGGELIFKKQLKEIFSFKWLALIVLTILFILPEIYALYLQFDLHPEKVVFGKQHVSGVKFFLWDSQFGRFAGNGPITRKSSSVFFYLHTLLWAFAPWCLLFYYALYKDIKAMINGRPLPEYYTLSGGLLLLILFSVSGFQLPFYTNILFPLFAVITSRLYFGGLSVAENKFRNISQWLFIGAFVILVILIQAAAKPGQLVLPVLIILFFAVALLWYFKSSTSYYIKLFVLSCITLMLVNVYLNLVLYPFISDNKAELQAAAFVNQPAYQNYHFAVFANRDNNFQFYCRKPVELISEGQFSHLPAEQKYVFYANKFSVDALAGHHIPFRLLKTFRNYPRENIIPQFINKTTRNSTLEEVYLLSN